MDGSDTSGQFGVRDDIQKYANSEQRPERLSRLLRKNAGKQALQDYSRLLTRLIGPSAAETWRFLTLEETDAIIEDINRELALRKFVVDDDLHPRLSAGELKLALGVFVGDVERVSDTVIFNWTESDHIGLLELRAHMVGSVVIDLLEIDRNIMCIVIPDMTMGAMIDFEELPKPYALLTWPNA